MTTTAPPPTRRRTIGTGWLALTAAAIGVFAPLRYLTDFTDSLPDLAAGGSPLAAGFGSLAVLWVAFAVLGLRAIRTR
jgi:hypothetical protein